MSRLGKVVGVVVLGALAGCAAQRAEESADAAGSEQVRRHEARPEADQPAETPDEATPAEEPSELPPGDEEVPPEDMPPEEPPDTMADPHSARPGAEEGVADSDPGAGEPEPPPGPAFRAPASSVRPVPAGRRPALPPHAKLAVACVRDGELVHRAEVVLELDTLLARESEVSAVFGLGTIAQAQVGLDGLVARAKLEGRDLLLVDERTGDVRTGYLLHVGRGVLLARFEVTPEGRLRPPAVNIGSGLSAAFLRRMGYAYKRLRQD